MLAQATELGQEWRQVLARCDELTRRGHCGPELLRLASGLRVPLESLLQAAQDHYRAVQAYLELCQAWFARCDTLYRSLYVQAYAALDRGTAKLTINDGHARHAVPLDPDCALNTVQTQRPVCLLVPSDNASLLKFPRVSGLESVQHIQAKLDALWLSYDQEADALHTEAMAVPPVPAECSRQALSQIEQPLLLVQGVLLSLSSEQADDDDAVVALYGQCGALHLRLTLLVESLYTTAANVTVLRDNVLVKFAESTGLMQKLTQVYETVQSHRGPDPGLADIF